MEQPKSQQRNPYRARKALEQWGTANPKIWHWVDKLRNAKHRDWPSYIFLPVEQAAAIVAIHAASLGTAPRQVKNLLLPGSMLSLFSAWRVTQGIYRYDPALYDAVVSTAMTGEIPGTVLQHLPEWCVYIETPKLTAPLLCDGTEAQLHGVWAWLDRSGQHRIDVLLLGLDTDERLDVVQIPLLGTLEQSVAKVEADWRIAAERGIARVAPPRDYAEAATRAFRPILSLVLYIASEAADIGCGIRRPVRPEPKRTRHDGLRIFPADTPTSWDVGVRIGAALRRASRAEEAASDAIFTGRHVRPHMRRAHWHTFLTGHHRTARRVKWLPPIAINVENLDALPATIHSVDGG